MLQVRAPVAVARKASSSQFASVCVSATLYQPCDTSVAVATPRVDIPVTPAVPAPSPAPAISQAPASAASASPLAAAPPPARPATAAPDTAPASAPVTAATPSPPSQLSLAQQLAALAQSQGRAPAGGAAGGRAIPAPPVLRAPDPVVLPPHFCSAVERNAFYDEHFTPSKDVADEKYDVAIAAAKGRYDTSMEQCDAFQGDQKDACQDQAESTYESEKSIAESDHDRAVADADRIDGD